MPNAVRAKRGDKKRAAASPEPGARTAPDLLSPSERKVLAARTLSDDGTICRWMRGERVLPSTKKALESAARKLGLPIPASPAKATS